MLSCRAPSAALVLPSGGPHSRNRSARDDPLGRLPRDRCNEFEVAVVVQNRDSVPLRDSSDQQIGNAGSPVMSLARKKLHHFDRASEVGLFHPEVRKGCFTDFPKFHQLGEGPGAEEHLELNDSARDDLSGYHEGGKPPIHRRQRCSRKCALVEQVALRHLLPCPAHDRLVSKIPIDRLELLQSTAPRVHGQHFVECTINGVPDATRPQDAACSLELLVVDEERGLVHVLDIYTWPRIRHTSHAGVEVNSGDQRVDLVSSRSSAARVSGGRWALHSSSPRSDRSR